MPLEVISLSFNHSAKVSISKLDMILVALNLSLETSHLVTASGKISSSNIPLPNNLPSGSCLVVYVQEELKDGFGPVLSESRIVDPSVQHGVIDYHLRFKPTSHQKYMLGAILNVGWCGKGDETLRNGDYVHNQLYLISINDGQYSFDKDIVVRKLPGKDMEILFSVT